MAVALQKYWQEGWQKQEIAEYLGVTPQTVSEYFSDPMAEEVEEMLAEDAAAVRLDLAKRFLDRLERLDKMEEKLLRATQMIPTGWELEEVEGEVLPPEGSAHTEEGGPSRSLPKPVVTEYIEVPDVTDDLRGVWDEIRKTEEQIEDLLGLEAPFRAEVEAEVERRSVETKIWRMEATGDYPEQPVYDEKPEEVR
ncbi:hypothetical protein [Halomarina pelagica]|uniref:hypothetical protein n=1 Tax=Halomarina pelagica TaxID=2961599 RepID=UPI0020C22DFE|nr:hypothetical protein [Halomarina sp. BND7]